MNTLYLFWILLIFLKVKSRNFANKQIIILLYGNPW